MSLRLYEKFLEYIGCQWVGTGDDEEAAKAVLDARIAQAEAAEKAMESWLAWCHIGNVDGTWYAFAKAVADYRAAKEAVRKLEEGQS